MNGHGTTVARQTLHAVHECPLLHLDQRLQSQLLLLVHEQTVASYPATLVILFVPLVCCDCCSAVKGKRFMMTSAVAKPGFLGLALIVPETYVCSSFTP